MTRNTDIKDREEWKAKILRALSELRTDDRRMESMPRTRPESDVDPSSSTS